MNAPQSHVRSLQGLPFHKAWPVLVSYEARTIARSATDLLTLAAYPLAYLLLLGAGISGLAAGAAPDSRAFVSGLAFIVPGLIAMQANAPFASMMYRYQGERQAGLLALKLVQGVPPLTYLTGMTTVPVLQYLAQSGVVLLGALALGVRFTLAQVGGYLGFGILAAITWACLGGWLVFLIRRQSTRMAVSRIISLPLVFASPIFYPLDAMPGYLRAAALANPLTYQVELMRGGGDLGLPLSLTVTILILLIAVIVLALLLMRSEPLPGRDNA